jgi:hypothetical protein
VQHDDSSRIVTAHEARPYGASDGVDLRRPSVPTSVDDALRLAIRLAVEAGDYDRAAALLAIARRDS